VRACVRVCVCAGTHAAARVWTAHWRGARTRARASMLSVRTRARFSGLATALGARICGKKMKTRRDTRTGVRAKNERSAAARKARCVAPRRSADDAGACGAIVCVGARSAPSAPVLPAPRRVSRGLCLPPPPLPPLPLRRRLRRHQLRRRALRAAAASASAAASAPVPRARGRLSAALRPCVGCCRRRRRRRRAPARGACV
jgi:hypothetical protein